MKQHTIIYRGEQGKLQEGVFFASSSEEAKAINVLLQLRKTERVKYPLKFYRIIYRDEYGDLEERVTIAASEKEAKSREGFVSFASVKHPSPEVVRNLDLLDCELLEYDYEYELLKYEMSYEHLLPPEYEMPEKDELLEYEQMNHEPYPRYYDDD